MVLILVTFLLLLGVQYLSGNPVILNLAQLTLIAVLFGNAILMTKRIMPSTVGPAIQAGTWYTQGIMAAVLPLGYVLSYGQFLLAYVTMIVLAVSIVNGVMAYLKK